MYSYSVLDMSMFSLDSLLLCEVDEVEFEILLVTPGRCLVCLPSLYSQTTLLAMVDYE